MNEAMEPDPELVDLSNEGDQETEAYADDWDPATVKRLISIVKENPILYDKYIPDFTNKEKKMETWSAIASYMGMTEDQVMKRWKSLRVVLARNIYMMKSGAVRNTPDWEYFDDMSFMLAYVRNRKSHHKAPTPPSGPVLVFPRPGPSQEDPTYQGRAVLGTLLNMCSQLSSGMGLGVPQLSPQQCSIVYSNMQHPQTVQQQSPPVIVEQRYSNLASGTPRVNSFTPQVPFSINVPSQVPFVNKVPRQVPVIRNAPPEAPRPKKRKMESSDSTAERSEAQQQQKQQHRQQQPQQQQQQQQQQQEQQHQQQPQERPQRHHHHHHQQQQQRNNQPFVTAEHSTFVSSSSFPVPPQFVPSEYATPTDEIQGYLMCLIPGLRLVPDHKKSECLKKMLEVVMSYGPDNTVDE